MGKNEAKNEAPAEPVIHIAKIATCKSLSELSTLEYHVGYVAGNPEQIHFRLFRNIDGGGKFNVDWKPLAQIAALIPAEAEFAVSIFAPIYIGQSRNSHGFLAAALVAEGLVTRLENRKYRRNDAAGWGQKMQALISAGTNLEVAAMEKPGGHSASSSSQGKPAKKKPAGVLAQPVG